MESNSLHEVKMLTTEDVQEAHSEFIELALSNTLVLREIFKFLPASTLKSCSLVNKLWKYECHSHCRDNRKWMAKISAESPCASLVKFNELVGSMTLVPYNGLSLHVDQEQSSYTCQCNAPQDLFKNVLDNLTWRHLDILIYLKDNRLEKGSLISCAAARFGINLLERKITELESLEFYLAKNLQILFNSNWPPALPNLKAICFPDNSMRDFRCSGFSRTSFLTRLTYAAPNLKEIRGLMDYGRLQLLPEGKWACVKDFSYSHHPIGRSLIPHRCQNELEIASQFVAKRPNLRKFTFRFPPTCRPRVDYTILNVLIELSQMTMEDLEIQSCEDMIVGIQDSLQMPQLPQLRLLRLHMTSGFGQAIEIGQMLLNRHDGNGFPQLEEFHLTVNDDSDEVFIPTAELRDESDSDEIENFRLPVPPFVSGLKLRLDLDPASSSFVQINSLFPAVTDMHVTCRSYFDSSRLPYKQIFRLWQKLETVGIRYNYDNVDYAYNLDAAFCGLDEKEVEVLGQEDDNFLMAVELVPIGPCVLTMRNLQSFTIEYSKADDDASERGTYMTRVARMLARRYLPNATVNVP